MLIKIAWRNVWRNKLRSLVVIAMIFVGIWAGVFVLGFSFGLNNERARGTIDNMLSHGRVHNPKFLDEDENITHFIKDASEAFEYLDTAKAVRSYSPRLIVNAMAATASKSSGVQVRGINRDSEASVTNMHTKMLEGSYLEGNKKNGVIIGQKLAEDLKVGLKSKVVFTFQDVDNEIVSARFKVVGIFKSISSTYDGHTVFANIKDVKRLISADDNSYHEIAYMLHDGEKSKAVAAQMQTHLNQSTVRSWQEVSPELGYADEMMESMLYIIISIILLAMAFGILNTMLMAVLERQNELGMLLSVGMNKLKVFLMIMFETLFLAIIGGPLGIMLGYLTIVYFGQAGIDMSMYAAGLESLGMATVVYTELDFHYIINITGMVIFAAFISAIIPGYRALRLNPAEAVRAI